MTLLLILGKCHGCSPSLKKKNMNNQVQNSSKCGKLNEVTAQSFLDRISEMNITSEVSGVVSGDSSSLENSDSELPIELTAEVWCSSNFMYNRNIIVEG